MSNPNDFPAVQHRLAEVILTGGEMFTADEITADGRFAIDHQHRPLGRQNVIGRVFGWAAGLGLIEAVDTTAKRSRNPRRKAGGNRLWRATDDGRAWAVTFLAEHAAMAYVDPQLSLFEEGS